MRIISIHDKSRIESIVWQKPYLHLYELGDLNDTFFPHTVWYGLEDDDGNLLEIMLVFILPDEANMQILTTNSTENMRHLLQRGNALLPTKLRVQISEGLVDVLDYDIQENRGHFYKMALRDVQAIAKVDVTRATRLSMADKDAIATLYQESYPEAWVNMQMVEDKRYFGIWDDNKLVSIAGLHVYAPDYQAAALGAVTTHPDYRGQHLATDCIAGLCQALLSEGVNIIGLNVYQENVAAIKLYQKLGFEIAHQYEDYSLIASVP